ncbi:MAG: hypothetical protein HY300_17070 [Verrucomicrobia bacterium]|nr:hypothetical protein [Verrucomicrobiota bacterium]
MAKNRRNQSAAIRFAPAVKAILLCTFFCGAGVGYVWQKAQILELGRQIKTNETRLTELRRQNKIRRDQFDYQRSPAVLEQRVKELKLGLVPPQPGQIVTLMEASSAPTAASTEKHYVAFAVRGQRNN